MDGYWLAFSPAAEVSRPAADPAECAARCIANLRCLSFDYSVNSKGRTITLKSFKSIRTKYKLNYLACYINAKHSIDTPASSFNGIVHFSSNY